MVNTRALKGTALAGLLLASACAPAVVPPAAPTVPAPLAPRPLAFPSFHETQLPNGMNLVVLPYGTQPVASVNLYIRSGTAADPAAQAGLAGLTAELMTKGTTTRTATEISAAIEGVGGNLSASAGDDWLTVSGSALADNLPLVFDLLSDVTLRPTFPQDEVEIARQRILSALQTQLGQPQDIARQRFIHEVYGAAHPYGTSPVPGTVGGLQRADLERFHSRYVVPSNALLVVAGAVDAAQVEAMARRHFGAWESDAPAGFVFPRVPERDQTTLYLVHRPGSVQSTIWIGHAATRPDHRDYFPLEVMNRVLGGGSDSRLFQILREEKGWTYGAYSRLTRPVDVGHFAAVAEVRTEVTDSAVVEMMTQLRRLRDQQVPAGEFEAARNYLAGSFPLRLETPGQVAAQVAQARLLGVPLEWVTEYPQRIRAVTAQDVQRVAREHVQVERAAVVVVGDANRVLPMLDGIAPIVLYDVEGRPLQREDIEVRAPAGGYDLSGLQPHDLTYDLVVQGNPMGTMQTTLRREGDLWVSTTTIASPMLGNQESELRFSPDGTPVSYRESATQAGAQLGSELRVENGRVVGQVRMPPQAGGERAIDAELPAGTLLPGMEMMIAAVTPLETGRTLNIPVFQPAAGAPTVMGVRVTGEEQVTVGAGSFQTYRVEVSGGQIPMTYFLRRQAPHIPVRQEFAGMPVSLELTAIR
jgi:zinc protease